MKSFPLWKVYLCIAVFIASILFMNAYDNTVDPFVSATVAVQQLEDSETGAIATRSYTSFQNLLPLGVQGFAIFLVAFVIFGASLFSTDLLALFKKESEAE